MSPPRRRGDVERLADILAACESIIASLEALGAALAPERIVVDAVKYNLVAIGEAANHVGEDLRAASPDVDWAAIRGLRNILAHEYFAVDDRLILDIADTHIPGLAAEARRLLG